MKQENIEDIYELSPMQQGMLFHQLAAPNSGVYFEQFCNTFQTKLNVSAFQKAWQQILSRHPILRTSFYWENLDKPYQVVYKQVDLPWEFLDWRKLSLQEQQSQLEALLKADRDRGFELSQVPLIRLVLIQIADETYQFIFNYHHILMEGWSLNWLWKEFYQFYHAFTQGQDLHLERPRPYKEYIVWLQQQDMSQAKDFWRETLKGFTASTPFLGDKASSSAGLKTQDKDDDRQQTHLSEAFSASLKSFVRKHHLTLNILFKGVWALLLSHYSRESDIVFGATSSGRPAALMDAESMVGLFINTLPMRVQVDNDTFLLPWLKKLQAQEVQMRQYEYSPMWLIQQWSEIPRGLPLFESILVFNNYLVDSTQHKLAQSMGNTKYLSFGVKTDYPLTIVIGTGSELSITITYDTNRFDSSMINRMLGHLKTLLTSMIANPTGQLRDLQLLTAQESYQLLTEWNNTKIKYPQQQSIHQLFETQVERTPNAIAVVFQDQKLTYCELNAKANQLAHYLQKLGVRPEVLVGICVERSLDMVIGLLGILKAGGAYVPLDPTYPQERLAFILKDTQVSVLLTQNKLLSKLPEHDIHIICLDTDWGVISQETKKIPDSSVTPFNLAYVIYTSGSTGQPKGVQITHRNLVHSTTARITYYKEPVTSFLLFSSFAFDSSVAGIFATLCSGGILCLPQVGLQLEISKLVELIAQNQVSHLLSLPSLYALLLQEAKPKQLKSLHTVIVAGEPCLTELVQRHYQLQPQTSLFNEYGPTEGTVWSSVYHCHSQQTRKQVSIGKPIANTQIYILDSNLHPVPIGVRGEIYISGDGLARGYLNQPTLTSEKFIPHPFSDQPGTRLYKTGDLACYLSDGNIEFLGRIDHQVKIRGYRIELGEIEAVLSTHLQIQQVVVIAREDIPGDKRLVAYVISSGVLTSNQLREFLVSKLPEYMIPSAFVMLDTIPLTPSGKVDRKALPAPDRISTQENEYVAPSTPSAKIIANIFSQVLGVENVGVKDNFFELGGHSLLATQLVSRLKLAFGVEIPLRAIFTSRTVAQLDEALSQLRTSGNGLSLPPIQPVKDRTQLPLSWAQERLWFLNQLTGSSATYNIPGAVRIIGSLDINALQQALVEIVHRHEVLRTSFATINSTPVQVIHPEATLNIQVVDLQPLLDSERETHFQQLAQQEAITPFDLEIAPLIRASLLLLSDIEYVLLLTMHHIVSDGWSLGVFISELSALYQAFRTGEPSPLPELAIQYADFAVWQREWLRGSVLETQLNYWRSQLQGTSSLLQLPTDRPRPHVQTYTGNTQTFSLTADLSQKLQMLSQELGTTLFMTLQAAFATLLHRYSGESDIVIGTPIANRTEAEIESLIGFFVNTLVLRTKFTDDLSFEQLMVQVRETTLQAYEHQDVPFEQVVEALQPQRSLSYSPLFQIMFILQNAPMGELELPDVTLTPLSTESTIAKFDLTVSVSETESGLVGSWEYNTDLFDGSTIARMATHFQNLLSAIVENPQQTVGELPLLSAAEQHQLSVEWNDTSTEYPSDKCIHQLFEEQVEKTPDAVAVVFEDRQLTYEELNHRANQLGHYLQGLGVRREVLVGICLEPSIEMVIGIMGILKAGGAYVPLDPNYPLERLNYMLEDTGVQFLLTQYPLTEKISSQSAHVVYLNRDEDRNAINRESFENLEPQATPDDLAYAIYTSGSTGKPKAVLGKMRGIVNRLSWMWEMLPFAADEICCQKTSINFVDHVAEIFSPLLKGIPLVVVPDKSRKDVDQLINLLHEQQITRIVLVPSLLKAMLENTPQQLTQLRSLKYVFCSGETLPMTLAKAFHQNMSFTRLFNLYGCSEVAADVTYFEFNPWEMRQRILQYFKPEVVYGANEIPIFGVYQEPFTKPHVNLEMLATQFQRSKLPLHPLTVDNYYDKFSQEVLPYTINTGSPTFIGHMTSTLPNFIHDMSKMISQLNQNLVKIETSKSLIFLEREAIAILHRLFYSFSDEFYQENIQHKNRNLGVITTGGTTANITALLCARNYILLSKENSWELSTESLYNALKKKGYHDIVIMGSRLMHYSFKKAVSILGLGQDNIVFIDNNNDGKIDINLLKEKIREYKRNNVCILAIVGIAGTTETGEIDPLFELGDIAQEFGIHFHVDGAWGGATIFSEKHKGKLKGIEKADSITICGHKQLYLPQGISICLFKDPQMLNFAQTTARYQAQQDTFDMGRFTIEGSRSALSLCLHGALHIIGKQGYEILINNGIDEAQYFSRLIQCLEPFDLIMEPVLNIVNYRYIPEDLRAKSQQKSLNDDDIQRINQFNTQIQREQFEQGLTFVSKTTLLDTDYSNDKEIVVFRAVLCNPNTTAADLHIVLEDQLRIANQIQAINNQEKFDSLENLPVKRIGSGDTEAATLLKGMLHLELGDNLKADFGEAIEEYLKKNTIPIGKPISNTQIYILDKYGKLQPPGVIGELYVGGDGLARGYLNRPELTQEKFILNRFIKDNGKNKQTEAERLYRTGDLARWLPDGNIEYLGRIDNQVKIRGFRIELGEIESVLNTYPQIQQAVVITREDIPGNNCIVAYLVTSDASLTGNQLRELVQQKLPDYMIPSTFVVLDKLPLTPNGKIDHKALPMPNITRPDLAEVYHPPQTEVEKAIANIWQKSLHVETVGIHDNFFELGGHSLLLVQIHSKLQKIFQRDFPLVEMFQYPTISCLATHLGQESSEQQSFTQRSPRPESRTTSIQRRKEARKEHRAVQKGGSFE